MKKLFISAVCMVVFAGCTAEKTAPVAVDLGLSVKWATFNVGASAPEDFGDWYAWAETRTKSKYSWKKYAYSHLDDAYSSGYSCSYDGVPRYIGGIDSLDAATRHWGGSWRMPTPEEFQELIDDCEWTFTNDYESNGVKGCIGTSRKPGFTDRSIFLPTADRIEGKGKLKTDCGRYWSDTKNSDHEAFYLKFDSDEGTVALRPLLRPANPARLRGSGCCS